MPCYAVRTITNRRLIEGLSLQFDSNGEMLMKMQIAMPSFNKNLGCSQSHLATYK